MIDVQIDIPREGGFLTRLFRKAFSESIQSRLTRGTAGLQGWARDQIGVRMRQHPTYQALKPGGLLSYELGLGSYQQPLVDECVDFVSRSVVVTQTPAQGDVLGGIRVTMLSEGIEGLIAERFALYLSYGSDEVPWLQWLLTGGSEILVDDYHIQYVRPGRAKNSRTGIALMIPDRRGPRGWTLPRAGTLDSNWVTDVLNGIARDTGEKVAAEIRGVLR